MAHNSIDQKIAAIGAITEGLSLRAVSRLTGLSRTRIGKLVLEDGEGQRTALGREHPGLPVRANRM